MSSPQGQDSKWSGKEKRARLGNLWVTGGSAEGLSEKAIELSAGGVEGTLLVFPAVVY
jgi:hypothetical protein